ncbi:MAG: hypothetical protein JKX68_06440, partial [Flavobacteriales bacterium]|nr:hypothetical protein [Flavobacteriales bacterium]
MAFNRKIKAKYLYLAKTKVLIYCPTFLILNVVHNIELMKYLTTIIILYILVGCSTKIETNQIQRIDGSSISRVQLDDQINTLVDTANVTGLTVT